MGFEFDSEPKPNQQVIYLLSTSVSILKHKIEVTGLFNADNSGCDIQKEIDTGYYSYS